MRQYNLADELQRRQFAKRVVSLLEKKAVVEMGEKLFRSPKQNKYLHLLIGVVAMETGNSLEDAKRVYFKDVCNHDLFHQLKADRMGNVIDHVRSTAELTKEEMTTAIERFKRWGAQNGIYLPNADEKGLLREIEIEMGRLKDYI